MGNTVTELKPGTKVRINITEPEVYTSDLYHSIQGEEGTIINRQSKFSCYENAYMIQFNKSALNKYRKTHSGKWTNAMTLENMAWWTEIKYFEVIN